MTESERYPAEVLGEDYDDGTMVENVGALTEAVVGHRIVRTERVKKLGAAHYGVGDSFVITLDDGRKVQLVDTYDCCASTELESFLLHPERVDHVITGVGTTEGFTRWHIYADMGDVLELHVGWSAGNPFYYAYGFDIRVEDIPAEASR